MKVFSNAEQQKRILDLEEKLDKMLVARDTAVRQRDGVEYELVRCKQRVQDLEQLREKDAHRHETSWKTMAVERDAANDLLRKAQDEAQEWLTEAHDSHERVEELQRQNEADIRQMEEERQRRMRAEAKVQELKDRLGDVTRSLNEVTDALEEDSGLRAEINRLTHENELLKEGFMAENGKIKLDVEVGPGLERILDTIRLVGSLQKGNSEPPEALKTANRELQTRNEQLQGTIRALEARIDELEAEAEAQPVPTTGILPQTGEIWAAKREIDGQDGEKIRRTIEIRGFDDAVGRWIIFSRNTGRTTRISPDNLLKEYYRTQEAENGR